MLAMTLVLVARVTMSVLKLQDILTDDVFDFILHIRLCHILSTYFFSVLSVVLFFQWVQTFKLLKDPRNALMIISDYKSFWAAIAFCVLYTGVLGFKVYILELDADKKEQNDEVHDISQLFTILIITGFFLLLLAFSLLLSKFVALINQADGALDFMKCQVYSFFTVIIILLSIREIELVMLPIVSQEFTDQSLVDVTSSFTEMELIYI